MKWLSWTIGWVKSHATQVRERWAVGLVRAFFAASTTGGFTVVHNADHSVSWYITGWAALLVFLHYVETDPPPDLAGHVIPAEVWDAAIKAIEAREASAVKKP